MYEVCPPLPPPPAHAGLPKTAVSARPPKNLTFEKNFRNILEFQEREAPMFSGSCEDKRAFQINKNIFFLKYYRINKQTEFSVKSNDNF